MAWTNPATAAAVTLTSAFWNAQVRDNFKAIGDPWSAFTSTLGNWTLGNGTIDAAYSQAGKLVQFRIKITVGSTTSCTSSPTLSLPVNAVASRAFPFNAAAYDTSAGTHYGLTSINTSASTLAFRDVSASLTTTTPFTWATGDELYVSGTYEAA